MKRDINFTRGQILRDFFLATDLQEIKTACVAMKGSGILDLPEEMQWQEIEYAFNRLFIGPKSTIAPLYASCYLDSEGYVMGETTTNIRYLYQSIGLSSPWEGIVPDDHISLEIDACLQIRSMFEQSGYSPLLPVYEHLLINHLQRWIPQLTRRIAEVQGLPRLIKEIRKQLQLWLELERQWLDQIKTPVSDSLFHQ